MIIPDSAQHIRLEVPPQQHLSIITRAAIGTCATIGLLLPAMYTEGVALPEPTVPLTATDMLPKPLSLSTIEHLPETPNLATPERLQLVEALLDQPDNPNPHKLRESYYYKEGGPFQPDGQLTTRQYAMQSFIGDQYLAKKYDVHIHNPTKYVTPLNESVINGTVETQPFAFYFSRAQAYLARFGVQLSIARESVKVSDGSLNPPQPQGLETYGAKMNMIKLIDSFSNYTQEYIDLAEGGNKRKMRVVLGTNPESIVLGATDASKTEIALNMSYQDTSFDGSTIDHEVYHDVHWSLFGKKWGIDPSFTALNNGQPYDKKQSTDRSLTQFATANDKQAQQYLDLNQAEKFGAACQSQKERNQYVAQYGPTILYATPYGGEKSVVEDRAEIGKHIADASYERMLSPDTPVIRKKLLHEMAELFAVVPKTLAYMIARDDIDSSSGWGYTDSSDCTKKIIGKGG